MAARNGHVYSDRSRPDGEVAEKAHVDKYTKTSSERKQYDDSIQEKSNSLYLERSGRERERDRERYRQSDKDWERDPRESPSKVYTSGAALNSKGKPCVIYFQFYLIVIHRKVSQICI